MSSDHERSIRREDNNILINSLDNPSCVGDFIRSMREGLKKIPRISHQGGRL